MEEHTTTEDDLKAVEKISDVEADGVVKGSPTDGYNDGDATQNESVVDLSSSTSRRDHAAEHLGNHRSYWRDIM